MIPTHQSADAGYLPDYQYEIIIGFDPEDDEPSFGDIRWVTQFSKQLTRRLKELLETGRARVWNSEQIRGNQPILPTTLEAIEHSATMVAILTPRYLAEQNPYREHAREFALAVGDNSGTTRLFNVHKLSCKGFEAEELRGYQFWDEVRPGEEMELMFLSEQRQWQAINGLAVDIRNTLRQLKRIRDDRPQVYLAPPAAYLGIQYEQLRQALLSYCRIVPEPGTLPKGLTDYIETVESLLAGSRLSIHMLGAEDDPAPSGFAGTTPSRLQFDLACARARERRLDCVVWCAENPLDASVGASAFIRSVLVQQDLPTTIDKLMPGNLVELQTRIRERLRVGKAPTGSLYLVRHPVDQGAVRGLEDELRQSGYAVRTADVDYQAPSFLESHTRNLKESTAAIVCAGKAPMDWLRFIDYSVRVHLGQSPGGDMDRFAVYFGPDKTADKEGFSTPFQAIRDYEAFHKAKLEPFLSHL